MDGSTIKRSKIVSIPIFHAKHFNDFFFVEFTFLSD